VEWGWNQEPGNTMFHVVNAYTRAAQFEGLSAESSYRLQKVGGMVLGMVKWMAMMSPLPEAHALSW